MEHSNEHPDRQLSILRDFLSGLNLGKVDLVLGNMQSNFITSLVNLDAAIQNGTGQNVLDPKGLAQKLGLTRVRARKVLRALVARRELTKAIEKTNLHDPEILIQLFDIASLFSIAAVEKLDTNTLAKRVGLTRTQSRKILRVLEKAKRPVQESEASVTTNLSATVQSLETRGSNYDTVTMNQEATNLPIALTKTNDGITSNETTQVASIPFSPRSQKPISPENLKSEPKLLVAGMDFLRQVAEGTASPAVVRKLSSNVPLRSFEMGRDKHTTVHGEEPNATNFEIRAKRAQSPRPFLSEQKMALQNNALGGDVRIFSSNLSTNITHDGKDMSEHQSNLSTQADVVVNMNASPALFGSKFAPEVNDLHNMEATKNNLVIPQPTSQTKHVVSHSMPTSVTSAQHQSESGALHSANITSEPGTAQDVGSLVDVDPLVSTSPHNEEEMATPKNIENMHSSTHGHENVRKDIYSPKSHARVLHEKEQLRLARFNSNQSTNITHDGKDMSEHQSNLSTQADVVVNMNASPALFGSKFAPEVNDLHNMEATKNNLVIPQPTSQTKHVVSHSMPTSVTSAQHQSESGALHSANITSEPGTAQDVGSLVDVDPLVSTSPHNEEEMATPKNIENMHSSTHGHENVRKDIYSPKSHARVLHEKEQLRLARLQMFKDDDSRLNESLHVKEEQALNEVQIEKNRPTGNGAIQRENKSNANDLDVVSKDVPEPISSLMFANQTRDKVNANPYQTETTGNNGWQGMNSDVVVFESNAKKQQSGNSSGTLITRVGVDSELSISRGDSVDQKAKSTSTKAENQKIPHVTVARDTTTVNTALPISHSSHDSTRQSLISSDFSYSSANPASADDILISEATFQVRSIIYFLI